MSTHLRFPAHPGYVYVLDIGQGYCKVGGTKRDPQIRCNEHQFSPQLDMFSRPVLYQADYVDNVWQIEHLSHQMLSWCKIHGVNDVYQISASEAVFYIERSISFYESLIA